MPGSQKTSFYPKYQGIAMFTMFCAMFWLQCSPPFMATESEAPSEVVKAMNATTDGDYMAEVAGLASGIWTGQSLVQSHRWLKLGWHEYRLSPCAPPTFPQAPRLAATMYYAGVGPWWPCCW